MSPPTYQIPTIGSGWTLPVALLLASEINFKWPFGLLIPGLTTVRTIPGQRDCSTTSDSIWECHQDRSCNDGWKQEDPLEYDPLQNHIEHNPNVSGVATLLRPAFSTESLRSLLNRTRMK